MRLQLNPNPQHLKKKEPPSSDDVHLDAPAGTAWSLAVVEWKGAPWITRQDEGVFVPLATAFKIIGGFRFVDLDNRAILLVKVWTEEDRWALVEIDAAALIERGGTGALAKLRGQGLRMSKQGQSYVLQTLLETQPKPGYRYHRPGWRDGYFVPPIGPALFTHGKDVSLADDVRIEGAPTAGRLEAWKMGAAFICASEADALQVGLVGGVIGPIIDLLKLDAPSIIMEGPTSSGKSTALALAAGAWGSTKLGDGLFVSLKGTVNSHEVALERGNGTLAALDEAHGSLASTVTDLAFMAQGGSGKSRLNSSGDPRRRRRFNTPLFLSAETQHTQRLQAEGLKAPGGLSVRLMAVSTVAMPKFSPKDWKSVEMALTNWGHYGPAFVKALKDLGFVDNPDALATLLERHLASFKGVSDPMKRRAAYSLALMATAQDISIRAQLLPASAAPAVFHRIWAQFLKGNMAPQDPAERAIAHLRESLVARRGIDVVDVGQDRAMREAVAYIMETKANRRADWGERVFVVRATSLSELSGGIADVTALKKALVEKGIAVREPSKRTPITWSSFPSLAKAMYLVLRADMIEAAGDSEYGRDEDAASPLSNSGSNRQEHGGWSPRVVEGGRRSRF